MATRDMLFNIEVELPDEIEAKEKHVCQFYFSTDEERQRFAALLQKNPKLGKTGWQRCASAVTVEEAMRELRAHQRQL
jgi:hypothetical protein